MSTNRFRRMNFNYLDCGCHFFGFATGLLLDMLAIGTSLFDAAGGLDEDCPALLLGGSSSAPSS